MKLLHTAINGDDPNRLRSGGSSGRRRRRPRRSKPRKRSGHGSSRPSGGRRRRHGCEHTAVDTQQSCVLTDGGRGTAVSTRLWTHSSVHYGRAY